MNDNYEIEEAYKIYKDNVLDLENKYIKKLVLE